MLPIPIYIAMHNLLYVFACALNNKHSPCHIQLVGNPIAAKCINWYVNDALCCTTCPHWSNGCTTINLMCKSHFCPTARKRMTPRALKLIDKLRKVSCNVLPTIGYYTDFHSLVDYWRESYHFCKKQGWR